MIYALALYLDEGALTACDSLDLVDGRISEFASAGLGSRGLSWFSPAW
jgi:hypothetical protein